ncbi:hypothetical protein GH714_025691 [Hevea brasiliensis]|uniref:Nudix hydrolase domain-containing protein n=1 Tax=Hevea brasiliensis TaxID=3981 RepID=A0A6A6LM81_HEVBR|nr:hypothetical protein GH714_025691 [Hevea brasiliensis]
MTETEERLDVLAKTELLLQRRADSKDSWPGLWDISSAGHISAGDSSLVSARRELHEELGIVLPKDAFELIFVFLQECDVYLVTTLDPIPLEAFTLQETEVSAVKYICYEDYRSLPAEEHPDYVSYDVTGEYGQLFDIIKERYKENNVARSLTLQRQLSRYASVSLNAELTGLSDGDRKALGLLVNAARVVDEIFYLQVWYSNPALRDWLKEHAGASKLDKLKWMYYSINKSPWIFTVIKRHSEFDLDTSIPNHPVDGRDHSIGVHDLFSIPYSKEYNSLITRAADLLHTAGDLASSPSHLFSSIVAFSTDSKLDVTIGPYETYEDALFGYKGAQMCQIDQEKSAKESSFWLVATSPGFLKPKRGAHMLHLKLSLESDDEATAQLKLFGNNLQVLEQNLPMDNAYKSTDVNAAPICVIQLIYNAGDVKGPQTVAFNLLNDERIVKERGTSMVMLKNVSEAKFKHILQPIADVCIAKEQKELVDFESFFTHTICHECCHGIGPRTITLPNGQNSTVRKVSCVTSCYLIISGFHRVLDGLQELRSALEEAKADIVGLWALKFLINKDLLPKSLLKSMYVSFLAGCFHSIRFGLEEAHGKGQAVQFNWLFEKEAFILHPDETFSVDFAKVPVDIAPTFTFAKDIME